MVRAKLTILSFIALVFIAMAVCCTGKTETVNNDADILIQYEDSVLTRSYVVSKIPTGLSAADSLKMFENIVEAWLEDMLLMSPAENNIIDMSKIDKMTADYRRRLIVNEYLRQMQYSRSNKVNNDDVKKYYEEHSSEMLLQQPLVKGVYIKIPDTAERIDDIRRWIKNASPQSIDKLEKYGLKGAIRYDYFVDNWVDWESVVADIPYHFGDADKFVANNKYFETASGGAIYILHISQFLTSGEVMPFDFAAPIIKESLMQDSRDQYQRQLVVSLSENALKEGRLKTPGYDIATGKEIKNQPNNTNKK